MNILQKTFCEKLSVYFEEKFFNTLLIFIWLITRKNIFSLIFGIQAWVLFFNFSILIFFLLVMGRFWIYNYITWYFEFFNHIIKTLLLKKYYSFFLNVIFYFVKKLGINIDSLFEILQLLNTTENTFSIFS